MIEQYLPSLIGFAGIYALAVISPGPDFAVVVRNSLIYSRKTGLFTALGISCGAFFHLSYILLGLGIIIAESPIIFSVIKYCGVGYLFYLGCKGLSAKKSKTVLGSLEHTRDIKPAKAFMTGFVTNVLNPKSVLFYLSIFSTIVSPDAPPIIIAIYVATIFTTKILWFSFVAICLSGKRTRERFLGVTYIIERVTGAALVLLSLRLLIG